MRLGLSIFFSLFVILSYGAEFSKGNIVNDYTKLSVTGRCEVIYEQKTGEPAYVRIEAGEEYRDNIDISTQTGSLSISTNIGNTGVNFYKDGASIKIYTNSKKLTEVSVSGNSKVVLKGDIAASEMKLSLRGSGLLIAEDEVSGEVKMNVYIKGNAQFKSSKLKAHELGLYIGGSGKMEIDEVIASSFLVSISGSGVTSIKSGAAHQIKYRVKGNGIVDALHVKTTHADTGISGSGKIAVNSSGYLKGRINGSGRINYSGNPKEVERKVYGAGKVLPADLPTN